MSSGLRLRKKPLTEVVRNLDAFPKVNESVEEQKRAVGGTIVILCSSLIVWLIISELRYYSETHFDYKFVVDTDHSSRIQLELDVTVATSCDLIGADIMDATDQPLSFTYGQLKMDKASFELNDFQREYFRLIKDVHKSKKSGQFQSLDNLLYIQKSLLEHIHKGSDNAENGDFDRKIDEKSEACRIHGALRLNKVAGNLHITPGKSLHLVGGGHAHLQFFGLGSANFSHRIEKLAFGPVVSGLVNPLDGSEKISTSELDLYQYYIVIVPTKLYYSDGTVINTCQYSMTQRSRLIDHSKGSHGMPGIYLKYDMSPVNVEIRQVHKSYVELLLRLCAIVGGVFATSGLVNSLIGFICNLTFCRNRRRSLSNVIALSNTRKHSSSLPLSNDLRVKIESTAKNGPTSNSDYLASAPNNIYSASAPNSGYSATAPNIDYSAMAPNSGPYDNLRIA